MDYENKTFNEIFEQLARHNDRSIIWNDWLNYTIQLNIINPQINDKAVVDYHGNQEAYYYMMSAWLNELSEKLEKYPYYDLLGTFYEELVLSSNKASSRGQFFSPVCVTELISQLAINPELQGKIANDPTCGSSRMLLSAHVKSKGELFLLGQDLDEMACKMSVLNFFSHGARGSILYMDTLEGTFYKGWRVNKYLYHGIPVPHIEEIYSPSDALRFIELAEYFTTNNDDNSDDGSVVSEINTHSKMVQSTLI